MNKVYILAGNFHQARICAKQNDLSYSDFIYVDDKSKILGLHNPIVWFTGTYYMNKLSSVILGHCRAHNIDVVLKELR